MPAVHNNWMTEVYNPLSQHARWKIKRDQQRERVRAALIQNPHAGMKEIARTAKVSNGDAAVLVFQIKRESVKKEK